MGCATVIVWLVIIFIGVIVAAVVIPVVGALWGLGAALGWLLGGREEGGGPKAFLGAVVATGCIVGAAWGWPVGYHWMFRTTAVPEVARYDTVSEMRQELTSRELTVAETRYPTGTPADGWDYCELGSTIPASGTKVDEGSSVVLVMKCYGGQ